MKLVGRLPGKVDSCRNQEPEISGSWPIYSSLAQLAEHAAVNRVVAGSSPARGAKKTEQFRYHSELFSEIKGLRDFRSPFFQLKNCRYPPVLE